MLIPPGVDRFEHAGAPMVCCGGNTAAELGASTGFVVRELLRTGDKLLALHVLEERVAPAGSTSDESVSAAAEQAAQSEGYSVRVEHLPAEALPDGDERNRRSAQQVLEAAAAAGARALVLVNYASQGMMQVRGAGASCRLRQRN